MEERTLHDIQLLKAQRPVTASVRNSENAKILKELIRLWN